MILLAGSAGLEVFVVGSFFFVSAVFASSAFLSLSSFSLVAGNLASGVFLVSSLALAPPTLGVAVAVTVVVLGFLASVAFLSTV